jgi:dTDP-4-amino-4,6-dideoxygalactose transaminase
LAKLAINGGPAEGKKLISMRSIVLPKASERDKRALLEVLESGYWCRVEAAAAKRSKLDEFEAKFAEYQDAKFGVSASNGTVALQLALRTLGVGLYDEVVVDANAFIASASAVTEVGAIPVPADIDPDTGTISPTELERVTTKRTKAVMAVHCAGYSVDMDSILPIAKKHNFFVIEDAATCVGSEWKGKKLGSIGDMGTFSFQQKKILTSGEGGMLLTNDEKLAERAKLLHNIGRVIGQPGYIYQSLSSNYRMTELQAALLMSRLLDVPEAVKTRHRNGEYLAGKLEKIGGLKTPKRDPRVYHNYYSLVVRYDSKEFEGVPREKFIEALKAEGVPAEGGYGSTLYKQPAFSPEKLRLAYPNLKIPDYSTSFFPHAEEFSAQRFLIAHPWFSTDTEPLDLIVSCIEKIKSNLDELKATPHLTH